MAVAWTTLSRIHFTQPAPQAHPCLLTAFCCIDPFSPHQRNIWLQRDEHLRLHSPNCLALPKPLAPRLVA